MNHLFSKTIQLMTRVLEPVLIVLFIALSIDVLFQVAARYLFSTGIAWTEELAIILLVWVSLIGAALGFITNGHLGIDIVARLLDVRHKTMLSIAINTIVGIFAFVVMIYGGGLLVSRTLHFHQVTSAMGVPRGYVYVVVPVSGVCIVLNCIYAIISATYNLRHMSHSQE